MSKFKKGESGNPAGRPRGSAGFGAWLEEQDFDIRKAVLDIARHGKLPSGDLVTGKKQMEALYWLFKRVEPERKPIDDSGHSGEELRLVLDIGEPFK